ncbi:DNA polymerase III subunit delta' [Priestia endophytica]|uniref:DNA polymerase III subunit delta' n=1 Tax=Priestia endophytica TaxID=135735 RepID=UPI000DE59DAF|nr:DNA polymerase III subunit delta' [Priestia endophytica]KAB2489596.1 DNA polymerase III subunit delta' [Priestia endophytica]
MVKTWRELEDIQPKVMKMIENSLNKGRVSHAYLFEGGRGTGKKDVSFQMAKSLFCTNRDGAKPCSTCSNCRRIESQNHPDVHFISPEGQSIKKEQIQYLQAEFQRTGVESRKKLYIIEHVNKMTPNAANSLLKFLEEPHADTYAILLTEQVHQLLDTIVSRCQVLSFQPLTPQVLVDTLVEHSVSPSTAQLLSHLTNSLEEALQLNEDEWFGLARKLVIKLNETLVTRPEQALFFIQEQWISHFKDKEQYEKGLHLLLLLYRDLVQLQADNEQTIAFIGYREQLKKQALQTTQRKSVQRLEAVLKAKQKLSSNMNPQLLIEELVLELQEG